MKLLKKITCFSVALIMALSVGLASVSSVSNLSFNDGVNGANPSKRANVEFEKVTDNIDLTGIRIENFNSAVLDATALAQKSNEKRTVIVTLDSPALTAYAHGGESVQDMLKSNDGQIILDKIRRSQEDFLSQLSQKGVPYELVDSYSVVVNAVAIEVKVSAIPTIKSISSVSTASVSETYARPQTVRTIKTSEDDAQTNPVNIYDTGIYDTSSVASEYGYDGNGMAVAILDTGLDYTHSAYKVMPSEEGLTKAEVKEKLSDLNALTRSANRGDSINEDDLYLNKKVPFAYDYADDDTDVYPSYSNHGAHVAGIVGGQDDSYNDKDGNVVNQIFRGSAPNAQLVICKVFTDILDDEDIGGATSEDIIAALEDCVVLGVDVINMSLGTSAGFSSISIDGDSEGQLLNTVYNAIRDAGISLICAASNDFSSGYGGAYGTNLRTNPDSSTVGSPSTFNGAMSVASINGQKAPYMIANGSDAIFFEESSDGNSVQHDFINDMLAQNENSKTFKYVVVPGIGQTVDYTSLIQSKIKTIKDNGEKAIVVIKRGTSSFQEKVELAQKYADAVIVYNNVAGLVRMNLGDLENYTPAISVSIDAGNALVKGAGSDSVGEITINRSYLAGPFMNDYSSWGPTPDLKLKPDVTAHGGEITSTVPGGYGEQSGTSMASPNLAGLTALVRQHVRTLYPEKTAVEVTTLTNQLIMSTAETVYNEVHLPYSPRKQGSGLATVSNIFSSKAYLYTDGENAAEDNRPKVELGDDPQKEGKYDLSFFVKNFGEEDLRFTTQSIFFTETLAIGGLAVAERAYILDDTPAVWTIDDEPHEEGDEITVSAGESVKITVHLELSSAEVKYVNDSFPNGMYVEGFIKLNSATDGQCSLNLPYMGFYGDWNSADMDMLDYDCYEIAEFEKDTSLDEDEKPKASVWATQAFAMYYNNKYVIPMGGYVYLQDENADQIYTNRDYAAISRFNEYYGEGNVENYMTTTGLKALYAGLLRNAELVTYDLYDAVTGEIVKQDEIYRVNKAYSAGGSGVPAQVLLEETPASLGLVSNGKYEMKFRFYRTVEDKEKGIENEENTFSMTFYIDYEAPLLTGSRIRYYDYKEGNKLKQRIYLDLDVYDNHYPQSVMLCYAEEEDASLDDPDLVLKLATEYVTPVYNPVKNGTTTVSLDITDLYDKYQNRLYVQIDDYALNHNVYTLSLASSAIVGLPSEATIAEGDEITIGVNEAKQLTLNFAGDKNKSNFIWSCYRPSVLKVKNGEIFGVGEGTVTVEVSNGTTVVDSITVHVVDKGKKLTLPSVSFGMIENSDLSLQKATGAVKVNAGQNFTLEVLTDPWYYPVEKLSLKWSSTNDAIASVTQNGEVTTYNERGTAVIKAVLMDGERETAYSASVVLNVQDPFQISNMTLDKYWGSEETVIIPNDQNIMNIGEEAFKDNLNVRKVIIPKTVRNINEYAFVDCSNLEEIYFISEEKIEPADADIAIIYRYAFQNCNNLRKIDFSNAKVVTVDMYAFTNCVELETIVDMQKLTKIDAYAFSGCTSLTAVDITNLHTAGTSAFSGCTGIETVTTGVNTVMSNDMFRGCTGIENIVINCPVVPSGAFRNCTNLKTVTFGANAGQIVIGSNAFNGCTRLQSVDFGVNAVKEIGNNAFNGCTALASVEINNDATDINPDEVIISSSVGTIVNYGNGYTVQDGATYCGNALMKVNDVSVFTFKTGVTKIGAYAFNGVNASTLDLVVPATVVEIGEGAFANSTFKSITIEGNITEISDSAFAGATLNEIFDIPATVLTIGSRAFENADIDIDFEIACRVERVDDYAFSGVRSDEIGFPSLNEVSFGNEVFRNSRYIEINLPVVTSIGINAFMGAESLEIVTYGAGSTEVGEGAFDTYYYGYGAGGLEVRQYRSALSEVTLNGARVSAYAFRGTALERINVSGSTEVGEGAFTDCKELSSVTGLSQLQKIGAGAFMNTALTTLDLMNAEIIGDDAFAGVNSVTLRIPKARIIGARAFYGTKVTSVDIPKTVEKIGEAAFNGGNVSSYFVDAENENFFANNGVLYRVVTSFTQPSLVRYELVAYPTKKTATERDGIRTYEVLEKTVTIGAYAFNGITKGTVNKVILPWSVKKIGDSAFYNSGISEFRFDSIEAPTLLLEARDSGLTIYALTNTNFEQILYTYAVGFVEGATASTLKVSYPTNGTGYDNFLYSTFFGVKTTTTVMMTDETRSLKENIESMVSVETVKSWANADFVVNAENTAIVQEFSDRVKSAHLSYNSVALNQDQLALLGEENANKLFEIENELKAVKTKFGIRVSVTKLSLAEDSAHKTEYKRGDKFDLSGLKIIVIYDDYSSVVADMSQITLENADKELTPSDRLVTVSGYGKTLRIGITVTEKDDSGESGEESGFNPLVIIIPVIAVVVLGGGAVAVILIIKKKKTATAKDETEENSQQGEDNEN